MYRHLSFVVLIIFAFSSNSSAFAKKTKILIFSKTSGFHHSSIREGVTALQAMSIAHDFTADTTTDAQKFNPQNLKQYAAVVFLNTTGDILNSQQEKAFEAYIRSGGGFVGVHAATDTEYDWPWYGKLVGAYFVNHPAQQFANLDVIDKKTIATAHLPEVWNRKDEWYNFKDISPAINVLINLQESSYQGGSNGQQHPMAWYHDFEGGRVFYTGLGHTAESYTDPLFLQHLWGGMQYVMGIKKMK
ncbi:Crp/Fnr family transcriptional regulator [Pedobacter sp. PACM 27299]|uniref:ThuA domain-containing protein n=1 Tax=Pedobacter sp. PACM 27299 TaxID=1727164 RepID=UPI0007065E76|nr:ThuA domain-containing protein [Pedobacter sp. PACM 27299]ALL08120.1 Crp/Fnr family transcriptional regulator [Pedobacter sp. PACM 27299]